MHLRIAVVLSLYAAALPAARADAPDQWAKAHAGELVELYRQFHRQPELSSQEEKTAARVAELWRQAGFDVTTGVGGHGVVGLLKNGPGPTLMLRTDLDALPVVEATGLVYASQEKVTSKDGTTTGVMHACGHDIHITNLVGVAQFLGSHKRDWSGTVLLVGQPAEERGEGARRMLEDGLFSRFPRPDMALALHVDATLEAGKVGYRAGYTLANVDSVDITMHGRGGHGAAPHATIDPIVQAAQLIMSLQTIVSREMDPIDPAVVTVGSIRGGTKHNVIPDDCHMQLTVRSFSDTARQRLLEGIRRKAKAVADGAGAEPPTIKVLEAEMTPALYNDDKLVERVVPVLRRALGAANVVASEPSLGGEDFSRYGRAGVPVFMFRLGSVEAQRLAGLKRGGAEPPSLHSAVYYPDAEPTLITGLTAMIAAALDLLPPKQ
jgi:hippurate hydrolase